MRSDGISVVKEEAEASAAAAAERRGLRARLLAERSAFVASPAGPAAASALGLALCDALERLSPDCIGLYCPLPFEFNAAAALAADARFDKTARALPYARKSPREMSFRRWDGAVPRGTDECGIGTSDGGEVVPDVAVVPCVGFTAAGHRLGYGGGYYDRWLASHGHVVAVGVAWSFTEVDADVFAARAHDVPLALVVTENGVV